MTRPVSRLPSPVSRLPSLAVALALMVRAGDARAVCNSWTANFTAAKTSPHQSAELTYTRSALVPGNTCAWTFDHYEICWNDGTAGSAPPAPANPASASACRVSIAGIGSGSLNKTEWVHRSNEDFHAKVFACGDAGCTQWYGDGSHGGPASGADATGTTDPERWVLEDVSGYNDSSRIISDTYASAASAVRYGANFSKAGQMGLWYSTSVSSVQTIMWTYSTDTTWQNWNTYAMNTAVPVAEQANGSGDFGYPTHPWVMLEDDGTTRAVEMFLQSDDDGNSPYEVWSVVSDDEDGSDFLLGCGSGGGCAVDVGTCASGDLCDWDDASADGDAAVLQECSDGTSGCDYLDSAGHGAAWYDYIASATGAVDLGVDTPSIVFSGNNETCYGMHDPDDIYTGVWDGTSAWVVPSASSCPTAAEPDLHDPSVVPLPFGEAEMYVQTGLTSFEVCTYISGTWSTCQPIQLAFDNGTTLGSLPGKALGECLENMDAFVWDNGAGFDEGAIFKADSGGGCFLAAGLVFAEHRN